MGTRKKKRIEFDLPSLLIETVTRYLGPTRTDQLSTEQAGRIVDICSDCAAGLGRIIEDNHGSKEPS